MDATDTSTAASSSPDSTPLDQLLGRIVAYYNLNNDSENETRTGQSTEDQETPISSTTPQMEPPLNDTPSPDAQQDVAKDDTPPSKRTSSRRSRRGQRKMENLTAQKSEAHYLSFAVDLLRIIDEEDGEDSLGDQ